MSQARVAAFGGAATFLFAAVVGVLGNQLTEDAVWSWVFFVTALTIGALATSWFAFHGAKHQAPAPVDPKQTARDTRRPLYDDAKTAIGVVRDDFSEVYGWIAEHGAGSRRDEFAILVPTRGHVLHTPPFGPLSAKLDESIAAARRAVSAMEWSGVVPSEVVRKVSWFVERADQLLDTCKGAYISKQDRLQKWLRDAEELRLVLYWDAIGAMKTDLAEPASAEQR